MTGACVIRNILDHLRTETKPALIIPARWPPLWDGFDVPMGDGVEVESDGHKAAQPVPDFEVDQRISW